VKTICKLILERTSAVVLGAWNTAILSPQWLKSEILQLPSEMPMEVDLAIGPTSQYRATVNNLSISPASDKFIIIPLRQEKEVFQSADGIINRLYETLPYTPIVAIGYNFLFELNNGEKLIANPEGNVKALESLYSSLRATVIPSSVLQQSVMIEEFMYMTLNLSFIKDKDKSIISMNYHYQADGKPEVIKESLNKFHVFYEYSLSLIDKFLIRK